MFFNIRLKIIDIFFCIHGLITALSKEKRVELVLLSGRKGWSYRRIADEFNVLNPGRSSISFPQWRK